jgi:hypothetical protein
MACGPKTAAHTPDAAMAPTEQAASAPIAADDMHANMEGGEQGAAVPAHGCKGMNECSGQGGCGVEGQNECRGQNPCAGKGGCNTEA